MTKTLGASALALTLGVGTLATQAEIVINEVNSIAYHFGSREFVELYNTGAEQSLDGLVLALFAGANSFVDNPQHTQPLHQTGQCYAAISLDGFKLSSGGRLVVGDRGVPGAQIILPFVGDPDIVFQPASNQNSLLNPGVGNLMQGNAPAAVAIINTKVRRSDGTPIAAPHCASEFQRQLVSASIFTECKVEDAVISAGNVAFSDVALLEANLYPTSAGNPFTHRLWERVDTPSSGSNFDNISFYPQDYPQGYSLSRFPDGGLSFRNGPQDDGFTSPQITALSPALAKAAINSGGAPSVPGTHVAGTFIRNWPTPGLPNSAKNFLVVDFMEPSVRPSTPHSIAENATSELNLRITRTNFQNSVDRGFSRLAVTPANYPALTVQVKIEDTSELQFSNSPLSEVTVNFAPGNAVETIKFKPVNDGWQDRDQPVFVTVTQTGGTDTVGDSDWVVVTDVGGATSGPVVINEIHAQEDQVDELRRVDANGDGAFDGDDQFVELLNQGTSSVDLTGGSLRKNDGSTIHVFPAGSILRPGQALVVFSSVSLDKIGAHVGLFGGAVVQTAMNSQECPVKFSLWDSGDLVRLVSSGGTELADLLYVAYSGGSLNRENERATLTDNLAPGWAQTIGHEFADLPPLAVPAATPYVPRSRQGVCFAKCSPGTKKDGTALVTSGNLQISLSATSIVENYGICPTTVADLSKCASLLTVTRPETAEPASITVTIRDDSEAVFSSASSHPCSASPYGDFNRLVLTFPAGVATQQVPIFAVNAADGADHVAVYVEAEGSGYRDVGTTFQVRDRGAVTRPPLVNGFYTDAAGGDAKEWIDLFLNPADGISLNDVVLVLYAPAAGGGSAYASIDLNGQVTTGDGFFRVGDANTHANLVVPGFSLSNSTGAIALYRKYADAPAPTVGASITQNNLLDVVFYRGNSGSADAGLMAAFNVCSPQRLVNSDSVIGDKVFLDIDNNGAFTTTWPGEGMNNIRLLVTGDFDGDGCVETSQSWTDTDGTYFSSQLSTGQSYVVAVDSGSLPPGASVTADPDGGPQGQANVSLTGSTPAIDFGYRNGGTVGDKVFLDVNSNNAFDSGEGIANVGVELVGDFDNDGQEETVCTVTDTDGSYQFGGLLTDAGGGAAKTYNVRIVTTTLPPGVSQSYDPDGILDSRSDATLTNGAPTDLLRDFGYRGLGLVGDRIFVDVNNNGFFDAGEGLVGVVVTLTGNLDNVAPDETVTTMTDANGFYSFGGLVVDNGGGSAKNYLVTVVGPIPDGLDLTIDPDGGADSSSIAVVSVGLPTNLAQDFGYRGPGVIGDKVFFDLNLNGAYDEGEGLPNITISLQGDFNADGTIDTQTTQTDVAGSYLFTGLRSPGTPANYNVSVILPAELDLVQTFDPDGIMDNSSNVGLARSSSSNLTRDFGYRGTGSVGDKVFFDLNKNNNFDAGEGIPGLTVTLTGDFNGDGGSSAIVATTDQTGTYSFGMLRTSVAGIAYTSTVTVPPGLTETFEPDGTLDNSSTITLTKGAPANDSRDFGYRGPGAVGDKVFFDTNGNSIFDVGEGIPGVPVTLSADFNGDGSDESINTTTDATGSYSFPELRVSVLGVTYEVTVSPPADLVQTVDPDAFLDNMGSASLTTATPEVVNLDIGYRGIGTIGDKVFFDLNSNGAFDVGEGIPGLVVTLTGDFNGDTISESVNTVTDIDGSYSFASLRATALGVNYQVTVTVPPGLIQVSDPDGVLDNVSATTLTSAIPSDLNQDFGYRGPGEVLGIAFLDANSNALPDAGEGLGGIPVGLTGDFNGDGSSETISTVTQADGSYSFGQLRVTSGGVSYQVQVSGPANLVQTVDPDSVVNQKADNVLTVALPAVTNVHFGYVGLGSIGDRVFFDTNGNGNFEIGEGLPGVLVTLTGDFNGDGSSESLTDTTESDGGYLFTGLRTSAAGVSFSISVNPVGLIQTVDPDAVVDGTSTVILTDVAPSNLDQDFGYVGSGQIGDKVYLDINGNSAFDAGEGLGGVTVTLTGDFNGDGSTESITQVTDPAGTYTFEDLRFSNGGVIYTVEVAPPAGVSPSADPDGLLDNSSSSTLSTGSPSDLVKDFGYLGTGSIGDRVFMDVDNDGSFDAGEGIAGVEVTLTGDLNGDGANEILSKTTDDEGAFLFASLGVSAVGITYTVEVNPATLPVGLTQTVDPDALADHASSVTLMTGAATDLSQDFGYRGIGSIAGVVFNDGAGGDLTPGAGEGIPNVVVTLTGDLDGDGSSDSVAGLTSATGEFIFGGLRTSLAGISYTVTVSQPAATTQVADPDATLNNATTASLTDGSALLTGQNFGYVSNPAAAPDIALWRQANFGSADNYGIGENGADPDLDGVVNLMEFAFGMNPLISDAGSLPLAKVVGDFLEIRFIQPANVQCIDYGAESSPDLIQWDSIDDEGTGLEHVFRIPIGSGNAYLRLKVTLAP